MMLKLVVLIVSLEAIAGEEAYCDKNDLRYLFAQVLNMEKQVKQLNTKLEELNSKLDETIVDLNSTRNNIREQLKTITASIVVNGGWSNWEPWGLCSATCGSGMNRRVRSCSNPTPSNGGNFCYGETSEYRLCNTANCQVIHGGWSLWTSWTSCSSSCTKTRTRSCVNPAPSQDGHMCQGDAEDKETCNLFSCVFGRMYVRLVGGSSSSSGRVEVSLDKFNWGTVCDDNFDPSDARVVCRMLGYSTSAVIDSSAVVGGSGPIYLDDLQCNGSETSLLYCQDIAWGNHNCGHDEDVGVSCS